MALPWYGEDSGEVDLPETMKEHAVSLFQNTAVTAWLSRSTVRVLNYRRNLILGMGGQVLCNHSPMTLKTEAGTCFKDFFLKQNQTAEYTKSA